MLKSKNRLVGKITIKNTLKGKLNNAKEKVYPALIDLEVIPNNNEQVFNHEGSYGYNNVTVKKIEDNNLVAENIKNGVDILGVIGTFKGGKYAPRYINFQDYTGTDLIEELAELDTSNITNMNYMFQSCYKLISLDVSNFNTSNVTNMYQMFNSCSKIASLDLSNFDTSNVTTMANMFTSCSNLTSLNLNSFDTSNVTNMRYMFQQCRAITDLPELSAESVTNIDSMFLSCNGLTNFGGLKDLGKAYLTTQSANSTTYRLLLTGSTLLTHDSLMNIINNLYDIKTKGCNTQALTLGATNLAKLTEEEIAIATNKGWTVS